MCSRYTKAINAVVDNFVAPPRFKVYSVKEEIETKKNRKTGIVLSYE